MTPRYLTTIKPMVLATVVAGLHRSKLNCSISLACNGGWDVKLGDEPNSVVAAGNFRTLEEAAAFLHGAALKNFPTSDYAARTKARVKSVRR
jgi:hypothetical protein